MAKQITGLIIIGPRTETKLTEIDSSIKRILEAARAADINIKLVTPEQCDIIVSHKHTCALLIDGQTESPPDFAMSQRGAYTTPHTYYLLRQCAFMGSYLCNGVDAIRISGDKMHTHQLLSQAGLPTPKTMLATYDVAVGDVDRELGFPVVVKNNTGSFGFGICLCKEPEQFEDLVELVYHNNPQAQLLLQEYIHDSHRADLRVYVIGGQVVGCMKRTASKGFKANIHKGGVSSPYPLTPRIERLAKEAASVCGLDVAGVDLLFEGQDYKICEVNSSPKFSGLEQVTGPVIAERLIDFILEKVKEKKSLAIQ